MKTGAGLVRMPALKQTCVACGGPLGFFGRRSGYDYHRCARCRTLQLAPLPTAAELAEAYRTRYAASGHCRTEEEDVSGAAQPYYDALVAALLARGARGPVLDVGAGWGGLCRTLLDHNFECRGIEPSEEMVAACVKRGLPVRRGDVAGVDDGPYGAIVLSSVFEHLVDHDAWLEKARSLLEPGGLLVTMQPTARFAVFASSLMRFGIRSLPLPQLHQVICPPWHVVLFSIEGMRALMARNGFQLIEVRPGPQARNRGLIGLAQRMLGAVNRIGYSVVGIDWPTVISHIFVFQKTET